MTTPTDAALFLAATAILAGLLVGGLVSVVARYMRSLQ